MTSVLFAHRIRPTSLSVALLLAVGVAGGLASCSGDDPAAAAPDPDAGTGGRSGGGGGEPDASSLADSGMAGTGGLGALPDGAASDGSLDTPDAEADSGGDGDPNGDGDAEVDSGPPCVIPAGAGDISAPPAP
ncbi:MAG TPA: hypothetical protein VHO25_02325, partial [Polyangiaceae bacterium]|nr:hypothetical protein [Polyangiaceae bacterium]